MFDKTFFRFAIGFSAIIFASMGVLYFSGYFGDKTASEQTASVR